MITNNAKTLTLSILLIVSLVTAQPPKAGGVDEKQCLTVSDVPLNLSSCEAVSRRTLTGQCTSLQDESWGQSRLPQFSYNSRLSSVYPITGLPSAREISNTVFNQGNDDDTSNSQRLNLLFLFYAQFIDHNLVTTPTDTSDRFDI